MIRRLTIRTYCSRTVSNSEWNGIGVSNHGGESDFGFRDMTPISSQPPTPTPTPPTRESEIENNKKIKSEKGELKLILERPYNLPPFEADPETVVTLKSDVNWDLMEKTTQTTSIKTKKRSSKRLQRKYDKYKSAVTDFITSRKYRKVRKMQKCVAGGLATEFDYETELLRLGFDVDDYPLSFKPHAYLAIDSQTIRNYLQVTDSTGEFSRDPHFNSLESLLADDTQKRSEWLDLQGQLSSIFSDYKKISNKQYSPLRKPIFYEQIKNLYVRRYDFIKDTSIDPIAPYSVRQVNDSVHGKLFKKYFDKDLLTSTEVLQNTSDSFNINTEINDRSLESFWLKCEAHKKTLSSSSVPAVVNPKATWKQTELRVASLQQSRQLEKDQTESDSAEYEMIYAEGDIPGFRQYQSKEEFSLHPSSGAYLIDEPVTIIGDIKEPTNVARRSFY